MLLHFLKKNEKKCFLPLIWAYLSFLSKQLRGCMIIEILNLHNF